MKKNKFFLFLLISITVISMTSNVFAGHNQPDIKIVKQNSQEFIAKNACNPCAVNPCTVKNACNPCTVKTKVKPLRSERFSDLNEAILYGENLWKDPKLGNSGLSCDTCHAGGNTYNKTALQAYPHFVSMPYDVMTLDQMINFCMINPMKGDPLPYSSKEMTALSAYFKNVSWKEIEKTLGTLPVNPCAAKNACNPCAANPCGVKNACNPCAGR